MVELKARALARRLGAGRSPIVEVGEYSGP
jgi:hypothetical protein